MEPDRLAYLMYTLRDSSDGAMGIQLIPEQFVPDTYYLSGGKLAIDGTSLIPTWGPSDDMTYTGADLQELVDDGSIYAYTPAIGLGIFIGLSDIASPLRPKYGVVIKDSYATVATIDEGHILVNGRVMNVFALALDAYNKSVLNYLSNSAKIMEAHVAGQGDSTYQINTISSYLTSIDWMLLNVDATLNGLGRLYGQYYAYGLDTSEALIDASGALVTNLSEFS